MKYIKIQTPYILCTLRSTLSKHKYNIIRPRGNEHRTWPVKFDPYVQRMAVYVEDTNRKNLKP